MPRILDIIDRSCPVAAARLLFVCGSVAILVQVPIALAALAAADGIPPWGAGAALIAGLALAARLICLALGDAPDTHTGSATRALMLCPGLLFLFLPLALFNPAQVPDAALGASLGLASLLSAAGLWWMDMVRPTPGPRS